MTNTDGKPDPEETEVFGEADSPCVLDVPESGFSIFLAERTRIVHFIRHAEGIHNEANNLAGDNSPTLWNTPGSEKFIDAKLTEKGKQQCLAVRRRLQKDEGLIRGSNVDLVVVSPLTRTLETAQIIFGEAGCDESPPFIAHDLCRERWGLYTCDQRRPISEVREDFPRCIDFDSFCPENDDSRWGKERESDESCSERGIRFLRWLSCRPERSIAVVSHSSFLRHLFSQFGANQAPRDRASLHRLTGNAEMRSVVLCNHGVTTCPTKS